MAEAPRILLVDDDRDLVLATKVRLKSAGFQVLTAHDGEQGLASALAHRPDAILLDVRMPRMDGLCTLARLRESDATRMTPVVMLSASLLDRCKALDLGARYFLEKPYDTRTLVAAIQSAMAEKEAGPTDAEGG
jgi:DNA-binding response OmpR family regulator